MSRAPLIPLVALASLWLVYSGVRADEGVTPAAVPRLGFLLEPSRAADLPRPDPDAPGAAPILRLDARWDAVERVPGAYDWTTLGPAVDWAHRAGYLTVLALTGSHPHHVPGGGEPSPEVGDSMQAWLAFVRSAARTFGGRVSAFELGDVVPGETGLDADIQALMLKQATLAVRAELGARNARGLIVQGALPAGSLEWQRALWERDLAAYIDVLPIVVEVGHDLEAAVSPVRSAFEESLKHPPAPELWAYVRSPAGWDAVGLAVASLRSGASAALFHPADEAEIEWASGLQRTFGAGYAPAALGQLRLEYDQKPAPRGARVLGRFFNEQDFTTLVVYHAPATGDTDETAGLVVDAKVVRNVRLLDPATGKTRRTRNAPATDGRGRVLVVETAPSPRAALYQKQTVTPGFELPSEELEVESERGLTAEEIIARFQQLQQAQDDRLERWMAKGRTDFHFKLAQGGTTVDVSIDSTYFWERDGDLEWEQTSYYINGNKVRWKNIPELPLIQPEKVITLPLDLTLDKTYTYRLIGEDRLGDRETYVIAFEPAAADPSLSLYRGRVWIDKQTFARLKASVIQNGLEPPVLSNEEIDRFSSELGPDGQSYWMFRNIDGQQVWNAAGRTFVVRRELTFRDFEINPPRAEFESRRSAAYGSSNQMLRDTDQGFRYLERQDDGTRTVKQGEDTSQLFAAGGAFKDNSQDNVIPLAGVNYFNYDLWGRDIQFNALFAGVLGFVTASKPSLGDTRLDLTADVGLSALKSDDQVFEGDDEIDAETVENRAQTLALRLGVPVGQFVKFNFIGGLAYRQYFDSDDAEDAIDEFNMDPGATEQLEFVLPEDHTQITGTAEVEFNRRGYSLSGAYSRAHRSDWETWGLRDTLSGEFGTLVDGVFVPTGGEPVRDDFTRWRVFAAKEWFLPKFQKIRGAVDYLNGSDLDRFSRYQFSFFGEDRLNGFSGTGVRFDEGVIGRVGYAFNLFEVIRLDAALESARVEQDDSNDEQAFTGIGLSGNFVGPWKTVININYGYAISSDIPDLEGEQEFLLLVFKLF